jgi:hypothetical protein
MLGAELESEYVLCSKPTVSQPASPRRKLPSGIQVQLQYETPVLRGESLSPIDFSLDLPSAPQRGRYTLASDGLIEVGNETYPGIRSQDVPKCRGGLGSWRPVVVELRAAWTTTTSGHAGSRLVPFWYCSLVDATWNIFGRASSSIFAKNQSARTTHLPA